MADVTITDITLAEGHPGGGNLIVITGTGFDADTQDMTVEFDGVASRRVRVLDGLSPDPQSPSKDLGTMLDCIVPEFPVTLDPNNPPTGIKESGSVDVKVKNNATVSEATATDGYEYKRPDLADPSHLELIYKKLINRLQKDVMPEVSPVASLDWSRPGEVARALAETPAILVEGPDMGDIEEAEEDWEKVVTNNDALFTWEAQRETLRVTLDFDITVACRGSDGGLAQVLSMVRWVQDFFRRNPYLLVEEGATGAKALNIMEYPMTQHVHFQRVAVADDIFAYKAVIQIEEVGIQVGEAIVAGYQFQVPTSPTLRITKKA